MTEQPITCRSVCERIAQWNGEESWDQTMRDARLALAQPDDADLREAHDAVSARLVEVQRQLDAANKRAEEAEAKQREAENAVAEQAEKIMEINRCVGFWQAMAETIIDRLVGRSAV